MKRNYYAGHSYMGTNYTYDSPCWVVYVFDSKKSRDEWVENNKFENGNRVAKTITRKIAYKIVGYKPILDYRFCPDEAIGQLKAY